MLKQIVLDTQGPIAEALKIGIEAMVSQQAEVAHGIAPKIQAMYEEMNALNARREQLLNGIADLKQEHDKALANIEYLKRQQAVIDGLIEQA